MLESSLATTAAVEHQKTFTLKNDPPMIFFSMVPAVLALIDGQPVLGSPTQHLQKVLNTRALILSILRKACTTWG